MAEKISVEIGLEGGDDVRKTLEEIVGGVDGLKSAAEELGQVDATVEVKAEGANEAKTGIAGVKTAAEELGRTDATVEVKAEGANEAKAGIDGVKTAAEELGRTDATVGVKVEGADEAKAKIAEVKSAAEELGQTDATINVAAEGAAEAKGLLDPLSQTATIVGAGFDGMSLAMARAEKGTEAIGAAFTRLGARMTRSLGPLGVFARALGPVGIAAGVLAGALIKFGDSTADALNKLTVESAKLGLTAQQLDTLQQAFGRLGVAPDALASSLEKLKPLLGGGLFRLGDIAPPDVFAGLQQFIAQLERMPDGIERTKLALATLGDALGGQVIAGLQTGTISAQNFAAALGSVTPATQQQIVEAAKYQESLNLLNAAWTALQRVITPITTPILGFLTRELTIIRAEISNLVAQWNVLVAVVKLFASPLKGQAEAAQKVRAAWEQLKINNEQLRQTYQQLGQTAQGAGQQAAQAGQTAAQGVMVWNEALGRAVPLAQQAGQAAAQAGQQAGQGFMVWDEKLGAITQKQAELAQSSTQVGAASAQAAQQGTSAWQGLIPVMQEAVSTLEGFINKIAGITWEAISSNGVAAWNALSGAIQGAYDWVVKYINKALQAVGIKPSAPVTGGSAPGKASGGMIGGRGSGTSDSNLAWLSRGEYVMPARAVRQPGVLSLLEALRRSGRIPGFQEGGLSSGPNFPQGGWPFTGFGDECKQAARLGKENNQLIRNVDSKVSKASDDCAKHSKEIEDSIDIFWDALLKSSQGKNTTGVSSGPNFPQGGWPWAAGGLLGGRGTGTSDSNLAWLSRGEHIMPARAVGQPGVLAFLEALRRSGGNLRGVLDGMGRFALGGMVLRMPAFASGGAVGSMSHVTIAFPGLPAISGLRASSGVVDQLQKAAALAQVRSGGRKPSRYS